MKEIVLNNEKIQSIGNKDKFFSRTLKNSLKGFVSLLRKTPTLLSMINSQMKEGDVFIAKIPKEIKKKIESGELEMITKKDSGLFNGMIRRKDGKKVIIKQTEWEKINLNQETISNLNQIAIQASIAELTEMLFEIDKKLNLLIRGQQSDRISRVIAGIDQYEQAYLINNDNALQNLQLSNALQSLNEGRRSLMLNLQESLSIEKRDEKFTDTLWRVFGIDKTEVELFDSINKKYEQMKEDLKYINLSSLYIFRIHTLLKQTDSAIQSRKQYDEFCDLAINKIPDKQKYFPYEKNARLSLTDMTNDFKMVKNSAKLLDDKDNSIIIEIDSEEIKK
jgi:hypothetical protein